MRAVAAADLLVLDADPTVDIANLRRIRHVVLGGIVLDREALLRRPWAKMRPVPSHHPPEASMSSKIDRTRGRARRQPFLRPLAVLTLIAAGCAAGGSPGGSASGTWGGARLIQPAELATTLADTAAARPLLLHVGVRVLYRGGAIPGSRYVGPGSTAAGIDSMLAAVKAEPRDRAIVIYCGCCPAEHCPNMKPAFAAMHKAGFTNVKALMIVKDFEHDWAGHGYPTEKPAL